VGLNPAQNQSCHRCLKLPNLKPKSLSRMNTLLIIITFLILNIKLNAECYYSNYEIKCEVVTNSDKGSIYYVLVSACDINVDSIYDDKHLKNALVKLFGADSLVFHKNRFGYKYCVDTLLVCPEEEKEKRFIYGNGKYLRAKEILEINVKEIIQVPSYDYIHGNVGLADSVWLKIQPLKSWSFYTNLCSFKVLMHKENKTVQDQMDQLRNVQFEINTLISDSSFDEELYYNKLSNGIDKIINIKGTIIIAGCTD